ncbi:hypothetical protein [Nonomuraea zeae]|uniref:hypothetical protein n=1 Tax=Nonomuraea zeae TaxID=1642303 RepID=UPI00361CB1A8
MGTIAALVMTACGAPDVTADCVDRSKTLSGGYKAVDDRYCNGGSHATYTWLYGGNYSGGYVRGGTTVRPSDTGIKTRTGTVIQRGGFGSRWSGGGG